MTATRIENTEIFILHDDALISSGSKILYSPLMKTCRFIDSNTEDSIVAEYIRELIDYVLPLQANFLKSNPNQYTTLSLLPNQICNFHCSYCYSAQGRQQKCLSKEPVQKTIDFFIDNSRIKPQTLKLFISGGGEPLMTPDVTCFALDYAHERAHQSGFILFSTVISNGSIINRQITKTLKRNNTGICISFEVLEYLQNNMRSRFKTVSETLEKYGEAGIPVSVNSTITPLSVNRMEEMCDTLLHKYPFVLGYTMEPVTDWSLFRQLADMASFYTEFMSNYLKIKEKYKNSSTEIWCSLEQFADTPRLRYCPGKLCLTPEGTFSICHCASSSKEERYEDCIYGEVNEKGIRFDVEKFNNIININVLHKPQCQNCFAKWNCGGECLTRYDLYPKEYMDEVCRFNRHWLFYHLKNKMYGDYQYS